MLFGWNDYVMIALEAPVEFKPGTKGSIIGFESVVINGKECWTIELDEENASDLIVPTEFIRLISRANPPIQKYDPVQ